MAGKVVEMRMMPVMVQLRYLVGAGIVCFILSAIGLYLWEQIPLNKDTQPGLNRTFGYTGPGIVGVILMFSFSTLAVVFLYESSQLFVRHAYHPKHTRAEAKRLLHCALGIQVLLGLFFVILSSVLLYKLGRETASCGVIFCLNVQKHLEFAKTRGASFNFLIGFMAFCSLVPLSLVMWYRVYTLWLLQRAIRAVNEANAHVIDSPTYTDLAASPVSRDSDERKKDGSAYAIAVDSPNGQNESNPSGAPTPANPMAKPPSMLLYEAKPWKKQLSRVIGLCLGIVACAVVSFWLPNDPRRFHPANIARFANLTISRTTNTMTEVVSEMPYAWFRTGQIFVSENLILKLFPGNVFFYVYLLSTAIIVFVLRQTHKGRYWMQRRIPQCACFTYGEAAFMAATAWLGIFFFIYWVRDHNYKNAWGNASNPKLLKGPERWGRGLGQLAILFLSLLLLPVGRQSVIVTVLGVSRDGLLWFHRAVGYCMLAATLAHVVVFYYSFHQYGLLWHNLGFLPITVGQAAVINDFTTIAATWTTWFLFIAMGIFGLNAVRRRYYELFYYTHLAATYMTLPMMIFHAAAGWMYMLPGLTVFLADQLVRVWQRSAVVRVVHARAISEDTVEVAFSVPGRWDMRRVHPGQYVLVCVPELTALQWHPFTLTSVVHDDAADAGGDGPGVAVSTTGTVFYVHIKSMGPRTWTGRLYDLVRTGQVFSMGVEGPCGTPVDYSHYDDIVLVAGGIGAAPCVSVYGSLLRSYMRSADGAGVPRVRMVWSTRSASLVGAVADMLQLPVSYRNLVRVPKDPESYAATKAAPGPSSTHHATDPTTVEVPASQKVNTEDFSLDVYVTRGGELKKFSTLDHQLHEMGAAAAATGNEHMGREMEEMLPEMHAAAGAPMPPGAVNRGARLRVYEGRPDLHHEIRAAFLDPATGQVRGDVTRKLVLVCGPEGMVADVAVVAAEIGVVMHTEEFLF